MKVSRALLSVSDKRNIVKFAKGLDDLNIEILSTSGTAEKLQKNNLDVSELSSMPGFSEILGGKVKTLHSRIHASILADKSNNKDLQEIQNLEIKPIDLVVVNLYPFGKKGEKNQPIEKILENIDIGGSALIRSAAKNYQNVCVVTSPEKYDLILKELEKNENKISKKVRANLASEAFDYIADYNLKIANFFKKEISSR